ncbi:hypothetical protein GGF46_000693 [Coemansia sp. RSA 552]|nr:hypothetical protein GGF46_000693 [Coemansia sp. RSA 552]
MASDVEMKEEHDAAKGTAEEVDEDDVGQLDMSELGSKVWLVKVPGFLAEKWKRPRDAGVQLGKMRIYDRADKSGSNISILLNDTEENKDIPKEYRMQVANEKVRNMFIFSEARDPHAVVKPTSAQANKAVPVAMTGTVHHECTVTPHYSVEYKRIMRKRVLDRHKNARKVQVMSNSEMNFNMLSADNNVFDTAQKKPRIDTRMARMERKDLMNMLFAGFEKYPYWTLKSLTEHTKQPTAFLKEVLGDIAKLNKHGPYTNMYSLKPEFRKTSADAAAAIAAAAASGSRPDAPADDDGGDDDDDIDNIDEDDDFEDA